MVLWPFILWLNLALSDKVNLIANKSLYIYIYDQEMYCFWISYFHFLHRLNRCWCPMNKSNGQVIFLVIKWMWIILKTCTLVSVYQKWNEILCQSLEFLSSPVAHCTNKCNVSVCVMLWPEPVSWLVSFSVGVCLCVFAQASDCNALYQLFKWKERKRKIKRERKKTN